MSGDCQFEDCANEASWFLRAHSEAEVEYSICSSCCLAIMQDAVALLTEREQLVAEGCDRRIAVRRVLAARGGDT